MLLSVLGMSMGTLEGPAGGWDNPGEGHVHLAGWKTRLDDEFQRLGFHSCLTLTLTLPLPTYESTHTLSLSLSPTCTHFFRPHYNVIIIDRVGQRAISMKDRVKG